MLYQWFVFAWKRFVDLNIISAACLEHSHLRIYRISHNQSFSHLKLRLAHAFHNFKCSGGFRNWLKGHAWRISPVCNTVDMVILARFYFSRIARGEQILEFKNLAKTVIIIAQRKNENWRILNFVKSPKIWNSRKLTHKITRFTVYI